MSEFLPYKEFIYKQTREYLIEVCNHNKWVIVAVSKQLKINRSHLYKLLKKHNIEIEGRKEHGNKLWRILGNKL